jgi:CheY-like chemotaxis protein
VFEPFFTTKELGKGTGLGLATVFGIVKQNAGLIDVLSEPGRGTTFKLYFPRVDAEPVTETARPSVDPLDGTETVLLVEDEEQILDLGRRTLAQCGYTVLTALAPKLALLAAEQHRGPIHLLITDVVMPDMHGRELRDHLQIRYPAMRCLFMSGYTADVIAHHGVLDEGLDFLQKPFSLQTLKQKVREVLARDV